MIYKIRNKDGLYSMGGFRPEFNKKGKIWTSIGNVKLHLNSFLESGRVGEEKGIPEDWVIVPMELIETHDIMSCRELYESEFYSRKLKEDKEFRRYRLDSIDKEIENLKKIKKEL